MLKLSDNQLDIQVYELINLAREFKDCNNHKIMYGFDYILHQVFHATNGFKNIYYDKTRETIKQILYKERI